ncbi:M48 family metalloprotease [Oxalobacteraceae bacterium R-40]|uniref:M48 family metalloprotease n=1 Tax=Keguizhuia sedimenti TaxID=3064264 RepID=A0ABU1BLL5_9BURK|nr:M48 family metalloprotease [Oxalobacteraceae bacterium R-40]
MTRIALFVLAKLALLLGLILAADWIGMGKWISGGGIDLGNLFLFAAAFLLFGVILPSAFSKWVTKKAMLPRSITKPANASEAWLINTVQRQARQAGIKTPEVAVYDSSVMRAYAAGLDRDEALIAVSSGMLEKMDRREAEAVLEKKVEHVARGDMLIPVFFGLLACWMLVRIQHGL